MPGAPPTCAHAANGTYLQIAGHVICRQRPGTAKGFVFVSLEDETGVANAIVVPQLFERHRLLITEESFLLIEGALQNFENVIHVKAQRIRPTAGAAICTSRSLTTSGDALQPRNHHRFASGN